MSTDPTNDFNVNNLDIDELASRLIDHDIEISEIPEALRAAVNARVTQFGETRQQLLASIPHADSSTINDAIQRAVMSHKTQSRPRKLSMYIASLAAAAAVVAIIGVAVTRSSSSDQSVSDMAVTAKILPEVMGAPMTSEAPSDMSAASSAPMAADSAVAETASWGLPLVINDTNELQDLVSAWTVEGFVVPQKTAPLCDDPLRPAADVEVTFAGETAEIHFTQPDGVVVYRLSDCLVIVGIVP
ncbi:MAG: hypothetical protein WCK23_01220 [Actinomycetes bacterium]